jgi:DNA (cytosine-5)-methyltransferase 1
MTDKDDNNKKEYTVIELFAGAGGLALGLEKAGFKALIVSDNDKYCSQTLKQNKPDWNVLNIDVGELSEKGITQYIKTENGEIDLLSGGYPCQAFSYAGKKMGLNDVRGTLFYDYSKILSETKPKMFLAENVKGLLSHDKGRTLKAMIEVFENEGYEVSHKILNAWDYGVAQKRERIAIIGVRNDVRDKIGEEFKFPEKISIKPLLKDILHNVPNSEYTPYSKSKQEIFKLVPPGGCWRDLPEEIAKEYMGKSYYLGGGKTGIARKLSWDEPSLTVLCSPSQKQTDRCHPEEIRPFTIRESARIQDFPDNWQFSGPISQQYKQIGNAVPVGLAYHLGLSISKYLSKLEEKNEQ